MINFQYIRAYSALNIVFGMNSLEGGSVLIHSQLNNSKKRTNRNYFQNQKAESIIQKLLEY